LEDEDELKYELIELKKPGMVVVVRICTELWTSRCRAWLAAFA
jgi:hypothetical protein